jgi:YVTN family beta-propeller protein
VDVKITRDLLVPGSYHGSNAGAPRFPHLAGYGNARCLPSRDEAYSRGFAFIANQEGGAIAAVDLDVLAVAKHIPLAGSPAQVLAARSRPAIYALTPDTGAVHEIQTGTLRLARQVSIGSDPLTMAISTESEQKSAYILCREPRSLVSLSLDDFRITGRLALPEQPSGMALSPDGRTAAVSMLGSVRLIDLASRKVGPPLAQGAFGQVRFLSNGSALVASNPEARQLSIYNVEAARLITHLPVTVRPENLCFNWDGGQLFVTGEGMDAVVVVFPYNTPMVWETVLAGHAPGAMASSRDLLFVASPASGDISILSITTRKVIAVVQVGTDPGFIAVTPDEEYALVLNRQSGDVAVLRVPTITPNRYKSAALLTVIPVGSRPVSADFRSV